MTDERRGTNPRWTPAEDEILRRFYPTGEIEKIVRMTNRARRSIDTRADRLKVVCTVNTRIAERERRKDLETAPMEPPVPATPAPVVIKKPRGPADVAGPATFHPNFKFTECPSPPPALRTNTHQSL